MTRKILRVSRPCDQSWDELTARGTARYCSECDRVVHDLDAFSAKEVLALIRQHPEGFCGTYLTDQTGEFVIRERALPTARTTAAVAAVVMLSGSGCSGQQPKAAQPRITVAPAMPSTPPSTSQQCVKPLASPLPERKLTKEVEERLRAMGYIVDDATTTPRKQR